MAQAQSGDGSRQPGRHSLSRAASTEKDPEWREWFQRVERLRREAEQKAYRKAIYAPYKKDGQDLAVVRKRAKPAKLSTLVKKEEKRAGRKLSVDTALIRDAWRRSVGDIAAESDVFSFRNGVLTISVFSQSLLQEIRQFHQSAILQDLRDIWPASIPLVRIVYKPGKK